MELPKMNEYRSHKVVKAAKINSIEIGSCMVLSFDGPYFMAFDHDDKIFARYTPKEGDYLVQYEDGYLSFSPGEVFEKGYSPIGQSREEKYRKALLDIFSTGDDQVTEEDLLVIRDMFSSVAHDPAIPPLIKAIDVLIANK
jgi:hypothetical protein